MKKKLQSYALQPLSLLVKKIIAYPRVKAKTNSLKSSNRKTAMYNKAVLLQSLQRRSFL